MQPAEFHSAGGGLSALANGIATAAAFLSAGALFGLAAAVLADYRAGIAITLGWSLGFLLLAVLIAPYLRKSGTFGAADFLAFRFGNRGVRLVAAVIVVLTLVPALAAAIATGTLVGRPAVRPVTARGDGAGRAAHPVRHRARRHAGRDADGAGAIHRARHRLRRSDRDRFDDRLFASHSADRRRPRLSATRRRWPLPAISATPLASRFLPLVPAGQLSAHRGHRRICRRRRRAAAPADALAPP